MTSQDIQSRANTVIIPNGHSRCTLLALGLAIICCLVFLQPGNAQTAFPPNMSSIIDNDDGLLAGTEILGASFSVLGNSATLTINFKGPVDLWDAGPVNPNAPSPYPVDTGIVQIFLAVDRLSVVPDIYSGPPGQGDVIVSHEEPKGALIVQRRLFNFEGDSAAFFEVSGSQYSLTIPLSLLGDFLPNETVTWGFVSTSAQVPVSAFEGPLSKEVILGPPFIVPAGSVMTQVMIDIKPGSDPVNPVNPKSKGVIPVAVLGSMDFDATQVDFSTVEFGSGKASPVHDSHVENVNGDGFDDMVFHFKTQGTGITCGDTEAILSGETFGGDAFTGTDSVKTSGCK